MLPTLFNPSHTEYTLLSPAGPSFPLATLIGRWSKRKLDKRTFALAVYQVVRLQLLSVHYVEAGSYRIDHRERTVKMRQIHPQ